LATQQTFSIGSGRKYTKPTNPSNKNATFNKNYICGGESVMDHKEKDIPAKIEYSIWDTRTNENLNNMKEKYAETLESPKFKSKTTEDQE
jgi:GTPase SAR1 family protein